MKVILAILVVVDLLLLVADIKKHSRQDYFDGMARHQLNTAPSRT